MSHENESWDIWTLDLDRGTRMRLRVKGATLAWHTLRAALEDRRDTITTE